MGGADGLAVHKKKSFYRAFNAIFGNVGRVASANVVVELFKTKCMPLLLCGLDACPVSSRQLRSLNHVVVLCARKIFNVNTSEIAAKCGVSDIADAVAMRKDKFIKRYSLNSIVQSVRYAVSLSSRINAVTCFLFYYIFINNACL